MCVKQIFINFSAVGIMVFNRTHTKTQIATDAVVNKKLILVFVFGNLETLK